MVEIRRAEPADAEQLVELSRAVGSEPEGWLISVDGWRSVAEGYRKTHYRRGRDSVDAI